MFPHIALQAPERLWLLLALVPAALLLVRLYRARLRARGTWGEERVVSKHTKKESPKATFGYGLCWLGILALLVFAIARPIIPDVPDRVRAGSVDIISVYDVSDSFRIEDYRGRMPGSEPGSTVATGASGSRLHMARHLTEQIMRATSGNYMGLVTFAGRAWRLAPGRLTNDYAGLRFSMDISLRHSTRGEGSNVAAGLMEALQMMQEFREDGRQKVIVLFSDGGYDGKPEDLQKVIEEIRRMGVRVIIVGLGGPEDKDVPFYDPTSGAFQMNLQLDPNQCPQENPDCAVTRINSQVLEAMARALNAELHYVPPGQTTLDINWSATAGGVMDAPRGKPIFMWCIYGSVVLLIIISLPGFRRRRDVEA